MLPEEAQALMAKILLVLFGTVMLCLSKVRANEIKNIHQNSINAPQIIAQKF